MTQRQIHNLELGEIWSLLRSRAEGLRPDEVAERLADIGPNALAPPPRGVWLRLLGKQFTNPFSLLLDVSAALCFVAEHMRPGEGMAYLGWALVAVAVLNALFTFAQAIRAERAMQALRNMLPIMLTQAIILFQDTSLVYVVGLKDFLGAASKAGQLSGRIVELYLFVALVFFLICFGASWAVKKLQAKYSIALDVDHGHSGSPIGRWSILPGASSRPRTRRSR